MMTKNHLFLTNILLLLAVLVLVNFLLQYQKLLQQFHPISPQSDSSVSYIPYLDKLGDLEQLNHPRIWIHISIGFGEGISKWRHSVPQLLGFAKLLNATLVEPCMKSGRLVSCNNERNVTLSYVFSDTDKYMIPTSHNYAPLMATYDEFRQHLQHKNASEVKFCLHKGSCADTVNYFQQPLPILHNISQYALGNNNLVINIPYYWVDAFQVKGTNTIKPEPSFGTFRRQHHDKVTEFLLRANIKDDEYAMIHWRGEVNGMDYMKCSENIIKSRKKMTKSSASPLPFLLMSSLNQDLDNMWGGAKQMALTANNTSLETLKILHEAGFLKLEDLMTEEEKKTLPDFGILAVYELILAARGRRFATCTRRNCHRHACQKCNYPGGFSEFVVDYRQSEGGKSSDTCWP